MVHEKSFMLRPMRLVALLDAAFRLYRRNFLVFVGIVALLQIPVSLLSIFPSLIMLEDMDNFTGDLPVTYFIGIGLSYVIMFLQYFLIAGAATLALTSALAATYFGEKIGIFEAYRRSWPALLRFLLVLILLGLLILGMFIWTLIPCVGWFTGPGILAAISLAVLPFAAPVMILEKHDSAFGVISRTWDLVRRRFWWVLGLAGVLYLLNLALVGPATLFVLISTFASESFIGTVDQNIVNTVVQTFISLLASILYLPIQMAVIMLAYFDLRVRTEGIDLFLNALEDEGESPNISLVAEMPTVKHSHQLISGKEVGYFVIITLVVILLYVALTGSLFLIFMASML
jgi:hypothetical protein